MSRAIYHLDYYPIPEGFQIFEDRLEVAGVQHRRENATAFAKKKKGWLDWQQEHDNPHDANAIKVFGCSNGLFGTKRRLIGYVPRDSARKIAKSQMFSELKPQLLKTYIGPTGFVEIEFQILGPKGRKPEFAQPAYQSKGHFTDNVDYVKHLKREKQYDKAIELLLELVNQVESEARKNGNGVAPWYYEQLAILYRKTKRYDNELAILERYDAQKKARGAKRQQLAERLAKVRAEIQK